MNWYKKAKSDLTEEEREDFARSKWTPVESSFITDIAYYEPLGMLEVKLKNGQEYSYPGIPKKVFKDLMRAKSKGEFFNRVIKKQRQMKLLGNVL